MAQEIRCWRDVLFDVWAYYNMAPSYWREGELGNAAGGALHCTLDDGNIRDSDIEYGIKVAMEKGDVAGEALGRRLLLLSPTQRNKLNANYHQYAYGAPQPAKIA